MDATPSLWQRTKIVCTLGPATDVPGILEQMIGAGMDVARVNMSHGDHADHGRRMQQVRQAAGHMGQRVGILADLPGPKFRVGKLDGGSLELDEGSRISLAETADRPDVLPVRHRELLRSLHKGESVYLADGSIELRVRDTSTSSVECEVVIGGTVRSGSGINVPESQLPALVPTEDDRRHLAFAVSQGVEWVGVSFVQSADDLARVRACLSGDAQPLLMAKIEKRRALMALDSIVEASDGIMVARGDLGVETDLAEIPLAQKRIIAAANARARPVITATQMLESMVEHEHPTRAEVTDVANAVLDGTDAVMLSAESAVGRYPVEAVKLLQRVLAATEAACAPRVMLAGARPGDSVAADEALGFVACQLAERIGARAIILEIRNLATAAAIARFRPRAPIVAVTESEMLSRSLAMVSGVSPLYTPGVQDEQAHITQARDWLIAHALARPGDRAVVLSASANGRDKADRLQVVELPA